MNQFGTTQLGITRLARSASRVSVTLELANQCCQSLDAPPADVSVNLMPASIYWNDSFQTFSADIAPFGVWRGSLPGAAAAQRTIGARPGEFVTVDALVNHMRSVGLRPSRASVEPLVDLREMATAQHGDSKFVGITEPGGGQRLFLSLPGGQQIPVRSTLDAPGYAHRWGANWLVSGAVSTLDTARVILRLAWSSQLDSQTEFAALALSKMEPLDQPAGFSLNANSVCDWFLLDTPLDG